MKIAQTSVELIDSMGSDLSVVNAARVSFHKESELEACLVCCGETPDCGYCPKATDEWKLAERDQKLLSYLAKHNHWTPFAHAFLSYRIKAPIFVARQLVKHQVGLAWNEVSRRYVDEEPEFYFPAEYHWRPDKSIKQGSGEVMGSEQPSMDINMFAHSTTFAALRAYNSFLNAGMAPEEARMFLPLNTMTEWIWSGSLAAFARVCRLRLDPHAQLATQEVAKQINGLVPKEFEHSWKALMNDTE